MYNLLVASRCFKMIRDWKDWIGYTASNTLWNRDLETKAWSQIQVPKSLPRQTFNQVDLNKPPHLGILLASSNQCVERALAVSGSSIHCLRVSP